MPIRMVVVVLLLLGASLNAYATPEAAGAAAVCVHCIVRSAPAPLPDGLPRAPALACTPGSTRLLL